MLFVGAIKSRDTSPFSPSEYKIEKDFSFAIPNAWPSSVCEQVQSQNRRKQRHIETAELNLERSQQKETLDERMSKCFSISVFPVFITTTTYEGWINIAKYLNAQTCTSSGLIVIGLLFRDRLSRAKMKDDSHVLGTIYGHITCLIKWTTRLYRRIFSPISARTICLPK